MEEVAEGSLTCQGSESPLENTTWGCLDAESSIVGVGLVDVGIHGVCSDVVHGSAPARG